MQEELQMIFQTQKEYNRKGSMKTYSHRINTLNVLDKMLHTIESKLLSAMQKDLGKHPHESYLSELGLVYRSIAFSKKHLSSWMKKKYVRSGIHLFPSISYKVAKPLGCSLIMSAFNYPVLLALDPLVGAIAAGNTAMLALSSQTPSVNQVLIEAFSLYFPKEIIYAFVGGRTINNEILSYPFDKIFFTGSETVGKVVMKAASENLVPLTLELGGKSPAVVCEDVNIKMAAKRIVWGKFLNTGQTCVAPDYVLIHESKLSEFLAYANHYLKQMYRQVEDSEDYERIINNQAMDRLIHLIETDQEFIVAGGSYDREKKYMEPTLLVADLNEELASMQDEIFGPILPILPFHQLEEALNVIAKHPKPLAFYPFVKNKKVLTRLLNEVDFGGSTINGVILHMTSEYLPFGGVGNSGMGSYHGKYSFDTFSHYEAVVQRLSIYDFPIMRAPYQNWKDYIIRKILK